MSDPLSSNPVVYFEREGVRIYHGDCIKLEIAHDLMVTDPPYGMKFESGWKGGFGPIEGDDNLESVYPRLTHALRGLGNSRHAYIFGNKLDPSRLPLVVSELIWDKQLIGMGDLSSPWGPQHEIIIFGVYNFSKVNRAKGRGNLSARIRKGSVLRSMRPNSRGVKHHPTEKPTDILRQMIESSSVMGETVYDPFAGSGSTLIAALLEGRRAIGCEIEERYCETAAKRLESEIFA